MYPRVNLKRQPVPSYSFGAVGADEGSKFRVPGTGLEVPTFQLGATLLSSKPSSL